jgi:phosphopantothenoylcysteine decarboxylase/phosphopantothenate--cysteine ligase
LSIGFAAETEKVIEHAKAKLKRKGCDWIVANDVSAQGGAMGGDDNAVHLITARASNPGRRNRRTACAACWSRASRPR